LHDNLLLRSRSAGVQGSPRILPKLECFTSSSGSTQMNSIAGNGAGDSGYASPQDFLPLRKIATAPDMMSSHIGSEPTRYGDAVGSDNNMMQHHRLFRRASKSKLIARQRQGLEPLSTATAAAGGGVDNSHSLSMMSQRRDSFASTPPLQQYHQQHQQQQQSTASLSPTVNRY
jgi:hypothetical protein